MTRQEADEQIEAATDAIRATLRQLLQEGQVHSQVALIGFRGGRVEGAERRVEALSLGCPASIGAAHALFGEPVVAAR